MDNNLEQQVQEQQNGLTIKEIFYIIKKHLIVILAIVVVLTGLGFGAAKFMDKKNPKWSASATMIVSVENTDGMALSTAYSLSTYLTNTYAAFVKNTVVLEAVQEELKDELGAQVAIRTLSKNVSTSIANNNLLMTVTYTGSSKAATVKILNSIMDNATKVANTVTTDDHGNTTGKYKLLYQNLEVLTPASESRASQSTRTVKFTTIGFAAGLVLAFLYVLIRELTDNKFKNSNEVERYLEVPVFAGIPDYEFEEENGGKK